MKAEAEANASSDKEARDRADKLNEADALIFQTEKQLKEFGDKIPDDKKEVIEKAVEELKEGHKAQDIALIETSLEALNAAWQAASQELYQAQQDAGSSSNGAEATDASSDGDSKSDDVTDVEYEEVEDSDNDEK